jgi:hypothetical protein
MLPESTGNIHNILTFNGRAALFLALRAVGVSRGEVIAPELTCRKVIGGEIKQAGARPVFAPVTRGLEFDKAKLKRLITKKTKAVISHQYFGYPRPLTWLNEFCDRRKIIHIEDCATSFFTGSPGSMAGSYGEISVFSASKLGACHGGGIFSSKYPGFFKRGIYISASPRRGMLHWVIKRLQFWYDYTNTLGYFGKPLLHNALGRPIFVILNLAKSLQERLGITPFHDKFYKANCGSKPWFADMDTLPCAFQEEHVLQYLEHYLLGLKTRQRLHKALGSAYAPYIATPEFPGPYFLFEAKDKQRVILLASKHKVRLHSLYPVLQQGWPIIPSRAYVWIASHLLYFSLSQKELRPQRRFLLALKKQSL